jgi:two-component system, cell cycle response regulator DivK
MITILVAEDDELILEMIERYMNLAGYRTLRAQDGHEAVEMAHSHQPDVIIMDLSMPRLNGFEATRALKADPATRSIPVIALTAYALAHDREQAQAAGCNDFESKPINFDQLISKINHLHRAVR